MEKEKDPISRRSFLARGLMLGAAAGALPVLASACGGSSNLQCTDVSSLTPAELATRQSLEYTDHSPQADKRCSICRFFTAAQSQDQCGTCQLVKGPIHPDGMCKSF